MTNQTSRRYGEYEQVNGGVANGLMNDVERLEQEVRDQQREIKSLSREIERQNK